jgi:hypothetical protein
MFVFQVDGRCLAQVALGKRDLSQSSGDQRVNGWAQRAAVGGEGGVVPEVASPTPGGNRSQSK